MKEAKSVNENKNSYGFGMVDNAGICIGRESIAVGQKIGEMFVGEGRRERGFQFYCLFSSCLLLPPSGPEV